MRCIIALSLLLVACDVGPLTDCVDTHQLTPADFPCTATIPPGLRCDALTWVVDGHNVDVGAWEVLCAEGLLHVTDATVCAATIGRGDLGAVEVDVCLPPTSYPK